MLDKIPMALIRRARGNLEAKVPPDRAAVRELCELLRPHAGPILRLLEQHSSGSGETEARFVHVVRAALEARHLDDVKSENLTGLALASFMLQLSEYAAQMARRLEDAVSRARDAASRARELARQPRRDAVLGGGGDEPSALPLSVYFDLSTTPPDQVVELLVALSDLYRSVGGDGLAIRTVGTMQPALIPAGA